MFAAAWLLALSASWLPCASLNAQQGSAVLFGDVIDATTGQPVSSASVRVFAPQLQGPATVHTDDTGYYRMAGLPAGTYRVEVDKPGYAPHTRTRLPLRAYTSIQLNHQLVPASVREEEIIIVGRAPTVSMDSSVITTWLTPEFTRRIPLAPPTGRGGAYRSFESVLEVVPGAQPDSFGVGLSGASSPENVYLLDGVSVQNSAYGLLGTPLSLAFIEEVSVLHAGYMPEYGQATGGIVHATTRSGSNQPRGSSWLYVTPGAWQASPRPVVAVGQTLQTTRRLSLMSEVGVDQSGPLVRDKLWYYLGAQWAHTSYDLQRSIHPLDDDGEPSAAPAPGSLQTFTARQEMLQALAKLTWKASHDDRLELSVAAVWPFSGGSGAFGIHPLTGLPEIGTETTLYSTPLAGSYSALAHRYLGDSLSASLRWSRELSSDARLDTWLGLRRERGGRLPSDGSGIGSESGLAGQSNIWYQRPHDLSEFETLPEVCPEGAGSCPVNDYRLGGPEFINRQTLQRAELRTVLTVPFYALGHHVFKTGLHGELQVYSHEKAYSGGRSLVEVGEDLWMDGRVFGYLTGPDTPIELDLLHNHSQSISLAGFIQDSWRLPQNITLNLGLRYDTQLLFANRRLAMALHHQWSPRIGLVYDPSGRGRSRLFANFARYYQKVPLLLLDRYLTGEPLLFAVRSCTTPTASDGDCFTDNAFTPIGSAPNRNYLVAGGGTTPVDPAIQAPSSDEIVVGGEYQIAAALRLGLVYTRRRLNRTIEDMSRNEAQSFFFGNPGFGNAEDFPRAVRKYDALTFYVDRPLHAGLVGNFSYTLSHLRGNYSGLFRQEDLQLDPHQNSDFDLISLTRNREGDLPNDHRHAFKLFSAYVWEIADHSRLTPGIAFRAQSGGPTSALGAHYLYGADQVYIAPRGTAQRLPFSYSADFRLEYTYSFSVDTSVAIVLEVFNLFNIQSAIRRDERYTETPVEPSESGELSDVARSSDNQPLDPAERNANFGRIVQYQAPRIVRCGIRGTF